MQRIARDITVCMGVYKEWWGVSIHTMERTTIFFVADHNLLTISAHIVTVYSLDEFFQILLADF